jgi:putative FmdB family regulatory protein
MPLYSFHCKKCDKDSEVLAGFDETPGCPHCGSTRMERMPSKPAAPFVHKRYIQKMRAAAARGGDTSNFSSAERKTFKS